MKTGGRGQGKVYSMVRQIQEMCEKMDVTGMTPSVVKMNQKTFHLLDFANVMWTPLKYEIDNDCPDGTIYLIDATKTGGAVMNIPTEEGWYWAKVKDSVNAVERMEVVNVSRVWNDAELYGQNIGSEIEWQLDDPRVTFLGRVADFKANEEGVGSWDAGPLEMAVAQQIQFMQDRRVIRLAVAITDWEKAEGIPCTHLEAIMRLVDRVLKVLNNPPNAAT